MSPRTRNTRTLMTGVMLVALALRVLIPPGFMPASGLPFPIAICWEGLPAGMLAQLAPALADSMGMDSRDMGPHHHGSPSPSDHCVFGTACNAGPIPHQPSLHNFSSARTLREAAFASIAVAVRVVHLPQPRAPPSRLT